MLSPFPRTFFAAFALAVSASSLRAATPAFARGDGVRLTKSETLLFKGANFLGAPKGQEFSVLQSDPAHGLVYVSFYKEDGTLIAVTLPVEALEPSPPDPWNDLLHGVEAFRDQRIDEARRLLARAAQDPIQKALAAPLAARINGAVVAQATNRQAFAVALTALRDAAEQLVKAGDLCLALPLDEGVDRLVAAAGPDPAGNFPASKLDRTDLTRRVTISNRAVARARQALALHRAWEATKIIDAGLEAEPARPELKIMHERVQKDLAEAQSRYESADEMRQHFGGAVHALTAIEFGLKACADHPKLLALRKEMSSAFEERTSPPVNAAFLAAAKVTTPQRALEEGHQLYTTHCTECHDLDLLDSRGPSGWQKAVAGMSGRAHLNDTQQARIVDYLVAALNTIDSGGK